MLQDSSQAGTAQRIGHKALLIPDPSRPFQYETVTACPLVFPPSTGAGGPGSASGAEHDPSDKLVLARVNEFTDFV